MKKQYKKWSRLILLGSTNLEASNLAKAISCYERAQLMVDRLIDNTIVDFDGDIIPLTMYSDSCKVLIQTHQHAGNSAEAYLELEQAARRLLSVMKNLSYPLLIRGKAIRSLEQLFILAIHFYQSQGRPDDALTWIRACLFEIKQQITIMRPVQETVRMN